MSHVRENLELHILELSGASTFDVARAEWRLDGVEIVDDFDYCPCGQQIKELCYIQNTVNGNSTYVGNVCVNQFVGIDTGSLFDGLRRINHDMTAAPNRDVIQFAWERGWLRPKTFSFLADTARKRSLSSKQLLWRMDINRRILHRVGVRDFQE